MRHRLFIPAATALLFALAACTQDELADDSRLSKEEYPIVIHATGLSVEATPSTRTTVDGDWQGVTSVALKIGDAIKGIHRYGYGCRRIQERHALTRERPVLLDQPQPDYRIGMVAHG